ncbi:right-handed parallel beta-helix repeat-containing protein [Alkalicoccobacillus plakortidis]|uniref:Right-handed parallel beta-helix repeat-containing protein n=1 Tax=Alkalicoccobacillus plakortidis TaxID=444060 RepID=A0ABT0XN22_9BACI|nr:right-handed parallel beta-helix repeat-containing protein [Alkalicoccobacillus plakortidis]MCM2676723.1 right-handed parallel beta-helix repeat-containing protein [Alkalicoccobacillus plakortidis]
MKVITVSQKILSKYKQLQRALDVVEEGGSIQLEEGTYKGTYIIDKSITISGNGEKDAIIIEGSFEIKNHATFRLKNVTIQDGETGIFVSDGSAELDNCDINRMSESALTIKKDSKAVLRDVIMQNNQHAIVSQGKASLLYCALSKQKAVQIILHQGAQMKLKHSHIFQGMQEAVILEGASQMVLEDCSVYGHTGLKSQISVQSSAKLSLISSRLYEGKYGGIEVNGGRLLMRDSELYRNNGHQIRLSDSTSVISQSYIHSGDIGCHVLDGTNLRLEQTRLVAHLQAQINVQGGQLKAKQCSILSGKGNGVLIAASGEAVISDSEIAGHFLPQICVSEQGNTIIERSSIHHGDHYGVWLTEQSSAAIFQSNIYSHQQIQVVVAEQSFLEMDTSSIYEGYENGLHFLEESKGQLTHCEIYRHGEDYPQIIVRGAADPVFKNCTVSESPSNAIWFLEEARGRIEQCHFVSHGLAQLEITDGSKPVIAQTTIMEGGHCAIQIREAGPYIEGCTFTDNEATILLEGNCPAEIIGDGAEALADFAENKRMEEERLSNLDDKTLERIQKANDLAEKEARTAEIVGLVEELERRLGKGY